MIELNSSMLTKIPKIDSQHKELIERINELLMMGTKAANRQDTEKMLDFLGKYLFEHFIDEERMLIEAAYPKFHLHRNQHQAFINTYEKLSEEYRKNGASIYFSHLLNKSVVAWATHHIQNADVEFAFYLKYKDTNM